MEDRPQQRGATLLLDALLRTLRLSCIEPGCHGPLGRRLALTRHAPLSHHHHHPRALLLPPWRILQPLPIATAFAPVSTPNTGVGVVGKGGCAA